MTEIERLCAIESIRASKARYVYGADNKDWEIFGSAFTVDAVWDLSGFPIARLPGSDEWNSEGSSFDLDFLQQVSDMGAWPHIGRDKIMAGASEATQGVVSSFHALFNPEVSFTSEVTADVVWPFEEKIYFSENSPVRYMNGHGYYLEIYQREGAQWLIKQTKIKPMLVTIS